MFRRYGWLLLALSAGLLIGGCFSGSDDDDDDTAGATLDCNPTACDAITGPTDCQAVADDPQKSLACSYCLKGTLKGAQIAQCILDNEGKAATDVLRVHCKELVDEQCGLATLDD